MYTWKDSQEQTIQTEKDVCVCVCTCLPWFLLFQRLLWLVRRTRRGRGWPTGGQLTWWKAAKHKYQSCVKSCTDLISSSSHSNTVSILVGVSNRISFHWSMGTRGGRTNSHIFLLIGWVSLIFLLTRPRSQQSNVQAFFFGGVRIWNWNQYKSESDWQENQETERNEYQYLPLLVQQRPVVEVMWLQNSGPKLTSPAVTVPQHLDT